MAGVAALAALCALGAAGDLRVEADVRTAARTRSVDYEDGPTLELAELEAVPRIALLRSGRLRIEARYDPRLLLPVDLSADGQDLDSLRDRAEVLHRGMLLAESAPTRRWTIRLGADGAYGRTDLSFGSWTSQPVPVVGKLPYVDARGGVAATAEISRRASWDIEAGAFASGGADAPARVVLPLQRGVMLGSSLGWSASRRDRLALAAAANAVRFSNEAETNMLRLTGSWARRLARSVRGQVGAGAVAIHSALPLLETTRSVAPWAEVSLDHVPGGRRSEKRLVLRLEPGIDSLTGLVDERLEATASVEWAPRRSWSLGLRALGAAIRPLARWTSFRDEDVPTTRLAIGEIRGGRRVGRHGVVSLIAWGRVQRTGRPDLPSFTEWGGALEATFTTAHHADPSRQERAPTRR